MATTSENHVTQVGLFVTLTVPIKARLRKRAIRAKSNMNDVAVSILADAYGVPFEPSGRVSATIGESLDVVLKMPDELKLAIQTGAVANRHTDRAEVLATLATGLGVKQK